MGSQEIAGVRRQSAAEFFGLLADILPRFREQALASQVHEQVSVRVLRQAGFLHQANTAAGLSLVLDEPQAFGGGGSAVDPAEALLAAVGASFSVTLTAHAALQGVAIDNVDLRLAAEIDARAFFEPGSGEPGLLGITMVINIAGPESHEVMEALVEKAISVAPVLATLKAKPKVKIEFGSDSRGLTDSQDWR